MTRCAGVLPTLHPFLAPSLQLRAAGARGALCASPTKSSSRWTQLLLAGCSQLSYRLSEAVIATVSGTAALAAAILAATRWQQWQQCQQCQQPLQAATSTSSRAIACEAAAVNDMVPPCTNAAASACSPALYICLLACLVCLLCVCVLEVVGSLADVGAQAYPPLGVVLYCTVRLMGRKGLSASFAAAAAAALSH